MELRHIRYFVRAAELLHFTQAAESLYISQPTLSTHIHQLEEELGTPLFDRIGRRVKLTEAGALFLEYANHALQDIDLAKQKIADLSGLLGGTLRIAALLSFGQALFPAWISGFVARHPQIRIEAMTGPSDVIEEEVRAGNVDLALSFVPAVADDLQSFALFSDEMHVVVNQSHPLADRSSITSAEFSELPLALIGRHLRPRRMLDSYFAEHKIPSKIVIEMDDVEGLLTIAAAGTAATVLGRRLAKTRKNVRLLSFDQAPRIDFGILSQANGRLAPPAKAFFEYMLWEFGPGPDAGAV